MFDNGRRVMRSAVGMPSIPSISPFAGKPDPKDMFISLDSSKGEA
jgi:hypothetical protein